jgi:hypothetical protein
VKGTTNEKLYISPHIAPSTSLHHDCSEHWIYHGHIVTALSFAESPSLASDIVIRYVVEITVDTYE